MNAKTPSRIWILGAALVIAAIVIWVGMYYVASGYIGRFWE